MSDPQDMVEYNALMSENFSMHTIDGEVRVSLPCPFCAAKNWLTYSVQTMRKTLLDGATCSNCGRSAKLEARGIDEESTQLDLFQTGGPEQPAWMSPRIRVAVCS